MKWIFVFALAVAMPASAQSIYKCRDAKGGAVYQSDPCAEAEKRWDTQPRNYTWDDHYKRQAAETSIERDRRRVRAHNNAQQPVAVGIGTGRRAATGASIPTTTSQCRAMRNGRDAYNDQRGTARTFKESRAWGDAVWEHCK